MENGMARIRHYFPGLSDGQLRQFDALKGLYDHWNARVNVISRKDMDAFYERHVLHSLAIAALTPLNGVKTALDLGTGGGFPGIPLAIFYPDTRFTLADSIAKKVRVVEDVALETGLDNVQAVWGRAETLQGKFDVTVTRAVAPMAQLVAWVGSRSKRILALKGGDLQQEIRDIPRGKALVHPIPMVFSEPWFETKVVVEWVG